MDLKNDSIKASNLDEDPGRNRILATEQINCDRLVNDFDEIDCNIRKSYTNVTDYKILHLTDKTEVTFNIESNEEFLCVENKSDNKIEAYNVNRSSLSGNRDLDFSTAINADDDYDYPSNVNIDNLADTARCLILKQDFVGNNELLMKKEQCSTLGNAANSSNSFVTNSTDTEDAISDMGSVDVKITILEQNQECNSVHINDRKSPLYCIVDNKLSGAGTKDVIITGVSDNNTSVPATNANITVTSIPNNITTAIDTVNDAVFIDTRTEMACTENSYIESNARNEDNLVTFEGVKEKVGDNVNSMLYTDSKFLTLEQDVEDSKSHVYEEKSFAHNVVVANGDSNLSISGNTDTEGMDNILNKVIADDIDLISSTASTVFCIHTDDGKLMSSKNIENQNVEIVTENTILFSEDTIIVGNNSSNASNIIINDDVEKNVKNSDNHKIDIDIVQIIDEGNSHLNEGFVSNSNDNNDNGEVFMINEMGGIVDRTEDVETCVDGVTDQNNAHLIEEVTDNNKDNGEIKLSQNEDNIPYSRSGSSDSNVMLARKRSRHLLRKNKALARNRLLKKKLHDSRSTFNNQKKKNKRETNYGRNRSSINAESHEEQEILIPESVSELSSSAAVTNDNLIIENVVDCSLVGNIEVDSSCINRTELPVENMVNIVCNNNLPSIIGQQDKRTLPINLQRSRNKSVSSSINDESKISNLFELYKCSVKLCCFATKNVQVFAEHLSSNHRKATLNCIYCDRTYFSVDRLCSHVSNIHGPCQYQCFYCHYRAILPCYILWHQKWYHENKIVRIMLLDTYTQLAKINKISVDRSKITFYRCSICEKTKFITAEKFLSHNNSVHSDVNYLQCHICDGLFSPTLLIPHFAEHEIDEFQCTYCSTCGKTKHEIKMHLMIKHPWKYPVALRRSTQSSGGILKPQKLVYERTDEFVFYDDMNENVDDELIFFLNKGRIIGAYDKNNDNSGKIRCGANINRKPSEDNNSVDSRTVTDNCSRNSDSSTVRCRPAVSEENSTIIPVSVLSLLSASREKSDSTSSAVPQKSTVDDDDVNNDSSVDSGGPIKSTFRKIRPRPNKISPTRNDSGVAISAVSVLSRLSASREESDSTSSAVPQKSAVDDDDVNNDSSVDSGGPIKSTFRKIRPRPNKISPTRSDSVVAISAVSVLSRLSASREESDSTSSAVPQKSAVDDADVNNDSSVVDSGGPIKSTFRKIRPRPNKISPTRSDSGVTISAVSVLSRLSASREESDSTSSAVPQKSAVDADVNNDNSVDSGGPIKSTFRKIRPVSNKISPSRNDSGVAISAAEDVNDSDEIEDDDNIPIAVLSMLNPINADEENGENADDVSVSSVSEDTTSSIIEDKSFSNESSSLSTRRKLIRHPSKAGKSTLLKMDNYESHFEERAGDLNTEFLYNNNITMYNTDCSEVSKNRLLYLCPVPDCCFAGNSVVELKNHLVKCHRRYKSSLSCSYCKRDFNVMQEFLSHLQVHLSARFFCSLCEFRSCSSCGLKTHMKTHHKAMHITQMPVRPGHSNPETDLFLMLPSKLKTNSDFYSVPEDRISVQTVVFSLEEVEQKLHKFLFKDFVGCGLCMVYVTKIRSNLVVHLKQHRARIFVTKRDVFNAVPCLNKNEKMFDKMSNHAAYHRLKPSCNQSPCKSSYRPNETCWIPCYVPEDDRYSCSVPDCKHKALSAIMLKRHYEYLHRELVTFRCPHCDSSIESSQEIPFNQISSHLRQHGSKLYRCVYCLFSDNEKISILHHLKEIHPDMSVFIDIIRELGTDEIKANIKDMRCTPVLTAKDESVERVSAIATNRWHCNICSEEAVTLEEIKVHNRTCHVVNGRLKCAYCLFRVEKEVDFRHHFENLHPDLTRYSVRMFQEINRTFFYEKLETKREKVSHQQEHLEVQKWTTEEAESVSDIAEEITSEVSLQPASSSCLYGSPRGDKFSCPLCDVQIKSTKNMISHLCDEVNYPQSVVCIECAKPGITLKQFITHINEKHAGRRMLYPPTKNQLIEKWIVAIIKFQFAAMNADHYRKCLNVTALNAFTQHSYARNFKSKELVEKYVTTDVSKLSSWVDTDDDDDDDDSSSSVEIVENDVTIINIADSDDDIAETAPIINSTNARKRLNSLLTPDATKSSKRKTNVRSCSHDPQKSRSADGENKKFAVRCKACLRVFTNPVRAREHVKRTHFKQFVCVCKRRFSTAFVATKHSLKHHPQDTKLTVDPFPKDWKLKYVTEWNGGGDDNNAVSRSAVSSTVSSADSSSSSSSNNALPSSFIPLTVTFVSGGNVPNNNNNKSVDDDSSRFINDNNSNATAVVNDDEVEETVSSNEAIEETVVLPTNEQQQQRIKIMSFWCMVCSYKTVKRVDARMHLIISHMMICYLTGAPDKIKTTTTIFYCSVCDYHRKSHKSDMVMHIVEKHDFLMSRLLKTEELYVPNSEYDIIMNNDITSMSSIELLKFNKRQLLTPSETVLTNISASISNNNNNNNNNNNIDESILRRNNSTVTTSKGRRNHTQKTESTANNILKEQYRFNPTITNVVITKDDQNCLLRTDIKPAAAAATNIDEDDNATYDDLLLSEDIAATKTDRRNNNPRTSRIQATIVCPFCSYKNAQYRNILLHLKTVHPVKANDFKINNYFQRILLSENNNNVVEKCGIKFATKRKFVDRDGEMWELCSSSTKQSKSDVGTDNKIGRDTKASKVIVTTAAATFDTNITTTTSSKKNINKCEPEVIICYPDYDECSETTFPSNA